ncbi:MAG TPA: hypothetical protein VML54_04775 [Candidatus Limnocylindrales bacterium]|nr:hypothetical protein [Candidatus Limnocylindrales bacterium]
MRLADLTRRKSIDALAAEAANTGFTRVLTATDLVFLGIGAIIGAGIFATVGTAAAGEFASGRWVRFPAGPAIILSLVFTGLACALAALCYAEMASMVPVGSRAGISSGTCPASRSFASCCGSPSASSSTSPTASAGAA